MVHSPASPPMEPTSPILSDSSDDDEVFSAPGDHEIEPSASRPGSPASSQVNGDSIETSDSVTCQWGEDCGKVFTHLPSLIDHIHNLHIGVHKSNYTCEWMTCPRRGLAQTSRFALISHIRSHTGEKPFTCSRPECDKSFTRSDALAKHMRLQHNITPPAPGRGGTRKRKRPNEDGDTPVNINTPPPPGTGSSASASFNTFKIDSRQEFVDSQYHTNGRHSAASRSPSPAPQVAADDDDEGYGSDRLPSYLQERIEPGTELIHGRSQEMVMYLLMKAKYKYAMQQNEVLQDELRTTQAKLQQAKEDKELAVDQVLRNLFGTEAEQFITPIPLPSSMADGPRSGSPGQMVNGANNNHHHL